MLIITYNGIKPNQKQYDFSVVGNARVDVVKFVLETSLDSLYTLEQLANFSAYCKIQSAGKEYIDKIPCQSTLENILDKDEQVIGRELNVELTLLKKTTHYRNLALQLQFETSGGEIVSQTQIVALTLSGNIPADKEISDEYPYIIQIMEGEIANKVDKVAQANKIYGTDENGEQTTYDKNAFGQVEDVKVNGASVVSEKVANIDLTPYEEKSNKVSSIGASSTNDEYPSAKCVYDEVKPIKDVIPAQATSENQLADKNFVNSSIATNTTNISDQYDNTKTYAVGDTCIYNNVLYKCITAITQAEAWDSSHWQATTVAELVADETIIYLDSGVYSSGSAMSDHDYEQLYPLTLLTFEELSKKKLTFVVQYSTRNECYITKTYVVRNSQKSYTGNWYDIQMYVAWFIQNFAISRAGILNHTF